MFTSNPASDKKYYNSLLPDPIKHIGSNLLHVSSDKKSCDIGQSVLAYKQSDVGRQRQTLEDYNMCTLTYQTHC